MKAKENTLSKKYPDLVSELCDDLNQQFDPSIITVGSNKQFFWKCKYGHIYKASIKSRINGHGCPICSNVKIVAGINDLQTIDPLLITEWDFCKNDILPTQVGAGSKKKVFWRCSHGHSWKAVIYDRHIKRTKCPYCSGKNVLEGENDFATNHPELVSEWDYEKNKVKPNQVHNKSSKKIWWKCKYGHSWLAPVYSRSNGIGCPLCAKESQTSFPEQAIFYYIKNYFPKAKNRAKICNVEADIFIPDINVIIEYDGEYWHRHKGVTDIEKNNRLLNKGISIIRIREAGLEPLDGCYNITIEKDKNQSYENLENTINLLLEKLGCNYSDVNINNDYTHILERTLSSNKANSLSALCPSLLHEWDYIKNASIIPDYLSVKSARKVWWICSKCGYSYKKSVGERVGLQRGCPICSTRKRDILHSGVNDVRSVYPELLNEWDYALNENIMPEEVSVHSSRQIWWKCVNGHSYNKTISKRIHDGGCPYCRGLKVLRGYNDFASMRSDLLYLWDFEKNTILPTEITYGSNKKVWWKCSNGHQFLNAPKKIIAGERCPYCSGRKIQSGINSLADINPKLTQEWDLEKNLISPDCVAPNSTKKFWWKCTACGHSWQATCANRHSKQSGCPQCYKRSRMK